MKITTSNDQKPINDKGTNVMKTQPKGAAVNPSIPKTEFQQSTQLLKTVTGGSLYTITDALPPD